MNEKLRFYCLQNGGNSLNIMVMMPMTLLHNILGNLETSALLSINYKRALAIIKRKNIAIDTLFNFKSMLHNTSRAAGYFSMTTR